VDHDHHPGEDIGYDHDHDWIDGERQPAREPSKIIAVIGTVGSVILILGLVADDITGIGASDDVFLPAAVTALSSFIIIIFSSDTDLGDDVM